MNRLLRMSYLVATIAGVVFFALSVVLLGIWPGRVLESETAAMSPPHPLGLTASEQRGRVIYSREGCAYCHTQQVRYLHADMARFGSPTLAWETRFDFPHLWGTRRIGPDLAREGATHSEDWQFSHLFAPRNIVPDSVMPSYPSLFNGSPDRPGQEARDLVSYLETLGRARELAGPEGEQHARTGCNCTDDEMKQMAFHGALNANPARAHREGASPALDRAAGGQSGADLYTHNCAGCHGARGEGDGPGATGLHPKPANLAAHDYTTARLSFVLWNGVAGTSMPAWRDLAAPDRSALAVYVMSAHRAAPEPSLPPDILDLGERVYRANCTQCHGDRGAGDGSAVSELRIVPANFQLERPSIAASLHALRNGVEGTQMAPWTERLNEAELSAVAYYVRTFFKGDAR
ncbi:MAG: cbb3-type cytochrome c oxidase subunit II [Acidobacteriota bacterium]|nr:cbb3-type cytochrome c oxidase subunit II [Acidobacteriota bacterium]